MVHLHLCMSLNTAANERAGKQSKFLHLSQQEHKTSKSRLVALKMLICIHVGLFIQEGWMSCEAFFLINLMLEFFTVLYRLWNSKAHLQLYLLHYLSPSEYFCIFCQKAPGWTDCGWCRRVFKPPLRSVRVPHLTNITDTHIYVCYGGSTVDTSVFLARLQWGEHTSAGVRVSLSIFLALCRHLPDINDAHIYARYGSSTVDTSVSFARLQQSKHTVDVFSILWALCRQTNLFHRCHWCSVDVYQWCSGAF